MSSQGDKVIEGARKAVNALPDQRAKKRMTLIPINPLPTESEKMAITFPINTFVKNLFWERKIDGFGNLELLKNEYLPFEGEIPIIWGEKRARVVSTKPVIVVFDKFFRDAHLEMALDFIDKNGDRFKHSQVDVPGAGLTVVDDQRKSETFAAEANELDFVRDEALNLLGLFYSSDRKERSKADREKNLGLIQLLRYKKGGYFKDHHDNGTIEEDNAGNMKVKPPESGDANLGEEIDFRPFTLLVYLSDNASGQTKFTQTDPEISVIPKKNRAVLWANVDKNGVDDPLTIHTGSELTENEKEKLAINIWYKCPNPRLRR